MDLTNFFKEYYVVQDQKELEWLSQNVSDLKPTAILEIGVEYGGTLKLWETLLPQNKQSLLIGIDDDPTRIRWQWYSSPVTIYIVKGNSHNVYAQADVASLLGKERKFDFLFIDAEHTPQAAAQDAAMYGQLVRHGGIIGFHDTKDIASFLDTLPKENLEYKSETIGTAIYKVP